MYQNTPNPFAVAILMGFNLLEGNRRDGLTSVSITISDAAGRVLTVINGDYAARYNTINVAKQDIQGAIGVLTYTVEAGEYTAIKQMIAIK